MSVPTPANWIPDGSGTVTTTNSGVTRKLQDGTARLEEDGTARVLQANVVTLSTPTLWSDS